MKPSSVKSLKSLHRSYSSGLFAFRHKPRSDGSRLAKKKWGRESHIKAFLLLSTSIPESQREITNALSQPHKNRSLTTHSEKTNKQPHQAMQYLNYFIVMLEKQQLNNFVAWLLFQDSFVKLHEREQEPLGQDL